MDTAELVNRLIGLFVQKKNKGLIVDAIGLAPAYHGLVRDRYVLGVSAPSLRGKDNYEKSVSLPTPCSNRWPWMRGS